jgi:hypothetical protein
LILILSPVAIRISILLVPIQVLGRLLCGGSHADEPAIRLADEAPCLAGLPGGTHATGRALT